MKALSKNYYNILNVSQTASYSEINKAYQILSDPTKRLKLNISLRRQRPKSFRLVGWEYDLFREQTFFLADKQFFLNQEADKGRQETIAKLF